MAIRPFGRLPVLELDMVAEADASVLADVGRAVLVFQRKVADASEWYIFKFLVGHGFLSLKYGQVFGSPVVGGLQEHTVQ